jgi:hypothetical protein
MIMPDDAPIENPPSNQTGNRTSRTAVQAGVPTGLVLVASYIVNDVFHLDVPAEVLIAILGGLIVGFAGAQNFAEDQGWIKDRRLPPAPATE